MKLRINAIDQLETDIVMKKNTAIYSVAKTVKKLHIQSDLHLIYKQEFYKDKQKEIYELFIGYLVPVMDDIYHPALIEE